MPGRRSRVVVGVAGGIAAYKAVEVVRGLTESGHDVTVVPTAAALRFVGSATWEALSGKAVHHTVWDQTHLVAHVRLGQQADLVVVVPATADLLARATHGVAGDLLMNILLTARCPILLAPAMHTEMWVHAATQRNVSDLRGRGVVVLEPAAGRLTGADSGPGRLPEPRQILEAIGDLLRRSPSNDLAGRSIVVSAGGTREPLDPVRFIGNNSSGRQGVELARTAVSRGASVTLVAANLDVDPPAGVTLVRVSTAAELHAAMVARSNAADVLVMAAAVADFRPDTRAGSKIKKESAEATLRIDLVQTVDVLADLVRTRVGARPIIVGFAAETATNDDELLSVARGKLARKGCDLLIVNDVGRAEVFGAADNEVLVLGSDGSMTELSRRSKAAVADGVWDAVARLFTDRLAVDA
ncbi:MAG: bifunctional phosphopantothenoylcysteine decarboxylase/phosphopantothenate--cysteine ligase CoaBC [Actinobacteria bacterium]|nr:bifunctional phosphopantothenoylcysteine decarboxylase/phosphopantothenate--cysteine ligase CoaBC [Actinomycetota bacterium]